MRYRGSSKIKYEHSLIPGLREFLEEELEPLGHVRTIIPGRIRKTKKMVSGLQVRYKYPVQGGAKLLAYSSDVVQELFIVTSRPEELKALERKAAKVSQKERIRQKGVSKSQLDQRTSQFLRGLGEPEPCVFCPSPFQEEALQLILQGDVVVTAPTGSGKTWIAERAIESFLKQGKACWYTTPLKALSNQKYDNFRKLLGEQRVGLLTGERKDNPSAPVIVATTEVFRNALYSGDQKPCLAVLDEAHYLGDEQRGTTWEEVIILAPAETHLLLLSATISNADEIVRWMERVRRKRPHPVKEEERPVPLRYGFLTHRKYILSLDSKAIRSRKRARSGFNPVRVVETLEERELLPAIIFLPSRKDCDRAASKFQGFSWKDRASRWDILAEAARDNPYLWDNPLLDPLVEAGIASHHAGHLTGWKVAVERILATGKLRAVFATTTLAAGLDVPARTVVLPTLMARDSFGARPLSTLEFQQMTGRAGRRGKDKIGFVVLDPENERDLFVALSLQNSEPEAIKSAFKISYHQILNLLNRSSLDKTRDILERSLLLFQQSTRKDFHEVKAQLGDELMKRIGILQRFRYLDESFFLTEFGRWAVLIRHENSLIFTEMIRRQLYPSLSAAELAGWIGALSPGRCPRRAVGRLNLESLLKLAEELERLERRVGISSVQFSAEEAWKRGAAVKLWAEGEEWERVVGEADIEEGDLQWLLIQTAEVLRQMEDLPLPIASAAKQAGDALLRAPVL
ncbi:MAG: DEAD/DEAH box helicase [Chloroflexi bacterium]|nr:DEAD/DEAH box helicase [Chloroflexota bacterium]